MAIPRRNGIELNWTRNEEPDLLGYIVYRRRPGETEYKRLTETPLKGTLYLDGDVESGEDYEYVITAIDNSVRRNESPQWNLRQDSRSKQVHVNVS